MDCRSSGVGSKKREQHTCIYTQKTLGLLYVTAEKHVSDDAFPTTSFLHHRLLLRSSLPRLIRNTAHFFTALREAYANEFGGRITGR